MFDDVLSITCSYLNFYFWMPFNKNGEVLQWRCCWPQFYIGFWYACVRDISNNTCHFVYKQRPSCDIAYIKQDKFCSVAGSIFSNYYCWKCAKMGLFVFLVLQWLVTSSSLCSHVFCQMFIIGLPCQSDITLLLLYFYYGVKMIEGGGLGYELKF
jgi:hypothetical protein